MLRPSVEGHVKMLGRAVGQKCMALGVRATFYLRSMSYGSSFG